MRLGLIIIHHSKKDTDEVKNHLKEMIEVGAIRKSNSPWASAVVLVRKKDGSL